MCVIVYIPKSRSVDFRTLRKCWDANEDGAGFMWNENGMVYGRKGFMELKHLVEALDKNGFINECGVFARETLIIHFRLATHGGISKGNCHPFPVTNKRIRTKHLSWKSKMGFAHNGIIRIDTKKGFSDSQEFVIKVLADRKIKPTLHNPRVREAIEKATAGSRTVTIFGDGDIWFTGQWFDMDGVYFSNLRWNAPICHPKQHTLL